MLKVHIVKYDDLQSFLDQMGKKVKFIVCYDSTKIIVIVDE